MLMTTQEDIALKLNNNLLQAAVDNGADMIATACPLCEMNLEAYQGKINRRFGTNFNIPIVYFSHLVGVALGVPPKSLGLDSLIIPPTKLAAKAQEVLA
jgi:heterodisulfide reductase subunit B